MPLQQVEVAIANAFKDRAADSAGYLPQDRELGQRPGHDAIHVYESSLMDGGFHYDRLCVTQWLMHRYVYGSRLPVTNLVMVGPLHGEQL